MTTARRPRGYVLLTACAAVLLAAAWAIVFAAGPAQPAAAEAPSVCAQKTPTKLKFQRRPGKQHGRLFWHARRGAHARFRVFRNGAIVCESGRAIEFSPTAGAFGPASRTIDAVNPPSPYPRAWSELGAALR